MGTKNNPEGPWITALQTNEPDGWDLDGTGMPGLALFGNAVLVFVMAQGRPDVTLEEAAAVFNVAPALIRQAVEDHPFLLVGRGDVIHADGE